MSKADLIAETMWRRLRSAGEAFRSGNLSSRYRAKPLIPGLPIQIEIHKERLKPRTEQHVRLLDKTENERVRSMIGSHLQYLNSLCHSPTAYTPMSIFGRFSGPGFTQAGYAVHALKSPLLFIDKIVIHDTLEVVSCPDRLTAMLESPFGITGSLHRVVPWIYEPYDIDSEYVIQTQIQGDLSKIISCDPYIKSVFDIEGPGGGLMVIPELPFLSSRDYFELGFTATTIRNLDFYSVLSQRVGSELAKKIQDFIQKHLTVEILEESSMDVPLDRVHTRQVMMTVVNRIRENQKKWPQCDFPQSEMEHAVGRAAAEWFIRKCSKI